MPTYVLTSKGFMNKATGEVEPFVNRIYTDANPAPLPRIDTSDEQEALVSMADGKHYTSKAAMRASYKASGNPQGENYTEVGPETRRAPDLKPKSDKAAIRDSIDRAMADLSAGRIQ